MLITSINNEHIKELAKLKEKKYRQLTNSFLVEGEHLVLEAYKCGLINSKGRLFISNSNKTDLCDF